MAHHIAVVSIIVPVYKVPEQYLRKCIESTMTQTLKKIEILLVDDGSPDQCGEICDEYAEKDKRIRVLHKKNGGLSSARNYGCKAAQGKWIMFVDGDDWIEPDMCQTMYSAGEEKQVQLVMCGIMKDYGKSATEYKFYLDDGKVYKGQECKWLQQQLLVYNGNIAVAYSKLIDRKLLINNQIFHSKLNAYKQFLSLFDYLSVREISGQKIIKKILEKDVPVVLDPTLLLERNYWDRLLKEATVCIPKQPYCFCYFLGNNKKHRESVKHLSQHKDYKIVNLQHFSGFCEADVDFADENLYAVSPQDFIALIANADYVCTDSFHCTAFSIQYEKNFTVFHRFEKKDKNSTNTRLYSLLEQLNLGTRIIDDGQDIIPNAVDYSICNNLLEKQRVISSEYLQEALRARKKF